MKHETRQGRRATTLYVLCCVEEPTHGASTDWLRKSLDVVEKKMGSDLAVVSATDTGCVIQRDWGGGYVVSHQQVPEAQRRVATLPCAYAACSDLDRRIGRPREAAADIL